MSASDRDIMTAVASLAPGAAWNFSNGKGLAGLAWTDPQIARPSDAAIEAEIARGAALPAAVKLDQHLNEAIAEFAPATPPPPQPNGNTDMATSSPATHALTIKEVLEGHAQKLDQVLQAQLALLATELDGQLGTVMKGTDAVIAKVRGNTDDFKAILGQFTNEV